MPQFELRDGRSNKHWAILRQGAELTTWWGTIGSKLESRTRTFSSNGEAIDACRQQVFERRKKGYVLVARRRSDVGFAHDEALAALVRRGFEEDAFAIYADFLEQTGDLRGRLAALHAAADLGNAAARAESRELEVELDAYLVGPGGADLAGVLHVDLRGGFAERALWFDDHGSVPSTDLGALLGHDALRFVRELVLYSHGSIGNTVIPSLLGLTDPPALRSLELSLQANLERGMAADLADRFPQLVRLLLNASFISLEPMRAPVLQELSIGYGSELEVSVAALEPVHLPCLRTLSLGGRGEALIRVLASAPILRRLETLDLRHCALEDSDVEALLSSADAFRHLGALRLDIELPFHEQLVERGLRIE